LNLVNLGPVFPDPAMRFESLEISGVRRVDSNESGSGYLADPGILYPTNRDYLKGGWQVKLTAAELQYRHGNWKGYDQRRNFP